MITRRKILSALLGLPLLSAFKPNSKQPTTLMSAPHEEEFKEIGYRLTTNWNGRIVELGAYPETPRTIHKVGTTMSGIAVKWGPKLSKKEFGSMLEHAHHVLYSFVLRKLYDASKSTPATIIVPEGATLEGCTLINVGVYPTRRMAPLYTMGGHNGQEELPPALIKNNVIWGGTTQYAYPQKKFL